MSAVSFFSSMVSAVSFFSGIVGTRFYRTTCVYRRNTAHRTVLASTCPSVSMPLRVCVQGPLWWLCAALECHQLRALAPATTVAMAARRQQRLGGRSRLRRWRRHFLICHFGTQCKKLLSAFGVCSLNDQVTRVMSFRMCPLSNQNENETKRSLSFRHVTILRPALDRHAIPF